MSQALRRPAQHGVGLTEACVHGSTHLLVEVREVPLVGRLDDTVSEMNRPALIFLTMLPPTSSQEASVIQ
jgi:hypothetical protein